MAGDWNSDWNNDFSLVEVPVPGGGFGGGFYHDRDSEEVDRRLDKYLFPRRKKRKRRVVEAESLELIEPAQSELATSPQFFDPRLTPQSMPDVSAALRQHEEDELAALILLLA